MSILLQHLKNNIQKGKDDKKTNHTFYLFVTIYAFRATAHHQESKMNI